MKQAENSFANIQSLKQLKRTKKNPKTNRNGLRRPIETFTKIFLIYNYGV